MGWLMRDGVVLASVEVADGRRARRRGLLGRDGLDGAILLRPCRSVHTFGMRFTIDVALCREASPADPRPTDADDLVLQVLAVHTLRPARLTVPRRGVHAVLEAEAGSFARWDLRAGQSVDVARSA